ncbi:expressed unknown protein [Seminavis robusta]|uniref:Uncharacterized protein n=1 Tax=Seminavis robusta TaxID=568900 RepID=A0A9N8EVD2_9STRA|nr:expressed unknown protein [Seminavis robusta]|eukprot:Sro1873_g302860.1 n/a (498) ;mRNA; r:888-2381
MDEGSKQAYAEACSREADKVFNFEKELKELKYHVVVHETHTNRPIAWVVPNLMTREECDCVMDQVECQGVLYGKEIPHQFHVKDIFDENGGMQPLSDALFPRLQYDYHLLKSLRSNNADISDQVHTVSKNWRVLKLTAGQEFPAHLDAMDIVKKGEECSVSTHSVLLDFHRGCTGAIRFYYRQYPSDGPYEYCVDVNLPKGWAVVMEQRPDLWYAVQPMQPLHDVQQTAPTRYVAQVGMLQTLEPGQLFEDMRRGCPPAFTLGPGLFELMEEEVERHRGEEAPRGWGEHAVSPKSTLWKEGRPIIARPKRLERRHSTTGMLRERPVNESKKEDDASAKAARKKPTRRMSLQAQVDQIQEQLKHVEGRTLVIDKSSKKKKDKGQSKAKKIQASIQERLGSSLVDFSTVGRERVARRQSLGIQHVTIQEKPFDGNDSATSITADFSESGLMEDCSLVSTGGRRKMIQHTRKPRKESIVGKLMNSFQNLKTTSVPVTADV